MERLVKVVYLLKITLEPLKSCLNGIQFSARMTSNRDLNCS